jgi:hypothetical protein
MLDFLKKLVTPKKDGTSPIGKVDGNDVVDVIKLSAFVALAAGLSSVLEQSAELDLGVYQPFVVLGLTTALDFVNKLVKSNKE